MAQNTSHAVMSQRIEANDSLDYFPTPPWATRALMKHIIGDVYGQTAWEPACGEGHMSKPLSEYFGRVYSSDAHDYGFGTVHDFLFAPDYPGDETAPDWIITNPPFRLGREFIEQARRLSKRGVAMLVRTAFLESADRYDAVFSKTPPSIIAQFVERVPMVKGRLDKSASTATSYCWLVWSGATPSPEYVQFCWIPPCRKYLEKASDYATPSKAS